MKKIPMRKCVATNQQHPKKDMLRVVKTKDGDVFVDITGKANGKGAYINKDMEALNMAIKKGSLKKALACDISEEVYEEIKKVING
ncbi:MAG: YlxR family protein [Erysipelotrichaceae bacterium]